MLRNALAISKHEQDMIALELKTYQQIKAMAVATLALFIIRKLQNPIGFDVKANSLSRVLNSRGFLLITNQIYC